MISQRPISPSCSSHCAKAFTILEILVAITILSVMMVFMFTLLDRSIAAWEIGNRRVEAAQATRIGLNRMASDFEYAFAGIGVAPNLPGNGTFTNVAPVLAVDNASASVPGTTQISSAAGSDQIFFIGTSGNITQDVFEKLGYVCAVVTNPGGYDMAAPGKYYLFRRSGGPDFHLRQTNASFPLNQQNFNYVPIMDNCVRMTLQYASTNTGAFAFSDNWNSTTNLPAGVLVTLVMIDSRAANKISQSKKTTPLTSQEIESITNLTMQPPSPEAAVLRRGATTVRRFIPFQNSR
jgi:type II secretory pathway pseudopilin PulG